MSDPRRPQRSSAPGSGDEPTEPHGYRYPPPVDPAYADQAPYAPTYGLYLPPPAPNRTGPNPTQRLPQYWHQGEPPPWAPPAAGEVPPSGPGFPVASDHHSPRWLWFVAGAAVLLVVGAVIALVIANGSVKEPTAVPPLPAMPTSSRAIPTRAPTTSTAPTTGSAAPTETTSPGAMQTVVYSVTGEGRAISITYRDTGNVMQTEFNVMLPWSKQVSLSQSATHPASVTVINIGNNVTCSVTVGGVQVRQHSGAGLTICDTAG